MEMAKFLALPDDEKVKELEKFEDDYKALAGLAECSICGGEVTAGDYCFGCHRLVCSDCGEPRHKCVS